MTSNASHEAMVAVADIVLSEPDDLARMKLVRDRFPKDPDDPLEAWVPQQFLLVLDFVMAELGPEAVRKIRANHRRTQAKGQRLRVAP
jgi:hypothetical protein